MLTITIGREGDYYTATDKETGLFGFANSIADAVEELHCLLHHCRYEYNDYPDEALTDEVIRIRDILNKRNRLMNDYLVK
jgi:hypothetical protein